MTRPVPRAAVERELARARGARRLLPWAALSAVAGGALGLFAGGGLRAAGVLFLVGLLFAGFLWTTATPRCPACGGALARRGDTPGACPRCHAPFSP